ncbi:UNVERIFIED_ORG: hypothetical protein J2W85_005859 [Ensifer adhaerens]|nr:hypothetical protein [Ensifer adhaerens]
MASKIGHHGHPPRQMQMKGLHAVKAISGKCVVLHMPDATLILALGALGYGAQGTWTETPKTREGMQSIVEHDLTRHRVVPCHQCGIIEKDLAFHTAKMPEQASVPSNQAD